MATQTWAEGKGAVGYKGSQRQGDEFYDAPRKENILGRKHTRLELWEEYLKDPITECGLETCAKSWFQ